MKKLLANKKYVGIALAFIIILLVAFMALPAIGTAITVENFPQKIGQYSRTSIQVMEKDAEVNAVFGQRISRTFMSNFSGPGANITMWVFVPLSFYKQTVMANMLSASMSKKTDMFYAFSTITEGRFPVTIFTGPGETIHNYIFFKNGKVFWLAIESNGEVNERFVFKEFFQQF